MDVFCNISFLNIQVDITYRFVHYYTMETKEAGLLITY